jgi:hypothetical protein
MSWAGHGWRDEKEQTQDNIPSEALLEKAHDMSDQNYYQKLLSAS